MLQQGVQLMLLGMGVVFALLALLVLMVKGMSRVAMVIDGPRLDSVPPGGTARSESAGSDLERVAAVTAAIHKHRAAAKREA